ncbi:MAG: DUF4386 domain-containing protein [Actinomycetia bacterium]|nr:DUF4386 domain-containing protein [Actinomycetes bacterium]
MVRMGLVDPDDPLAAVENITESEGLFRLGLISFLIDVVLAWALYIVFRPAGERRSLLAAWFRLTYTVFLGVAVILLFLALELVTGTTHADPLGTTTALALEGFNYTWPIGLAAFGIHLVMVGRMLTRAPLASPWLGIDLMVAGSAYVVDTLAYVLLSNYAEYENLLLAIVAIPAVVGELALTVWLLGRSGKAMATHDPAIPASPYRRIPASSRTLARV